MARHTGSSVVRLTSFGDDCSSSARGMSTSQDLGGTVVVVVVGGTVVVVVGGRVVVVVVIVVGGTVVVVVVVGGTVVEEEEEGTETTRTPLVVEEDSAETTSTLVEVVEDGAETTKVPGDLSAEVPSPGSSGEKRSIRVVSPARAVFDLSAPPIKLMADQAIAPTNMTVTAPIAIETRRPELGSLCINRPCIRRTLQRVTFRSNGRNGHPTRLGTGYSQSR